MLLFVVIVATTIGSRMDQHTISVLAGTASGFMVASVSIGGVAYVIGRKQAAPPPQPGVRYVSPMPQMPPNFAVLPMAFAPQTSYPQMAQPGQWGSSAASAFVPPAYQIGAPRKFFVIGASGEVHELADLDSAPSSSAEMAGRW
jgi:hypothetical protein